MCASVSVSLTFSSALCSSRDTLIILLSVGSHSWPPHASPPPPPEALCQTPLCPPKNTYTSPYKIQVALFSPEKQILWLWLDAIVDGTGGGGI